jgi:hypothetical protein
MAATTQGQAAAPLGPGEGLVVAHDDACQRLTRTDGLLQRTPALLVLQAPVGAGRHEHLGGPGVADADGRRGGAASHGLGRPGGR